MAKNAGVWGIDIGQCAFKAMRCQLEDGAIVADAFDYHRVSQDPQPAGG